MKQSKINPTLSSTCVTIVENRILGPKEAWFNKENSTLYVDNIYPCMFIGCGVLYTFEQCIDFCFNYANDYINRKIGSKN